MEMTINGEMIKELRLKKSWSQELLADRAGVSMRTVQRMETDGVASLQSRNAVANALEIDPADLLVTSESQVSDAHSHPEFVVFLNSAWSDYIKPVTRFCVLSILWIGMASSLFLIFATLVSGIFFWESMNMSFWQSTGEGLIGASLFVPIFAFYYYIYRRLTRTIKTVST